ncbi:MAG: imidazole glycerol phosphate synthase subunit HisH [Ruthenibacterium lactatiformans]
MAKKIRLIARLDVKNDHLVKGIQLEGLRKLGDPHDFAADYYRQGVDELLYMDIVASLYNRNNLSAIVRRTTDDVFIPITVGGGLRSVDDVRSILQMGADQAAINTAAIKDESIITQVAEAFGSQCMVLGIEAKKRRDGPGYEAYYDNGREHSGKDVIEWARRGVALGAGEILLTSVDKEGFERGMDCPLIRELCAAVSVPVIVSGGCGGPGDAAAAAQAGASAVAVASILHYKKTGAAAQGRHSGTRDRGALKMKITVIDYGLSNLLSVRRAFEYFGAEVEVTGSRSRILSAKALVLPGVGAFKDGMAGLSGLSLADAIADKCAVGTPLLGICLGMQMLFDESDEFGRHRGLGLIPGRVERIPGVDTDGAPQRVPHVGWAPVLPPQKRGGSFRGTVFEDVPPGGELYFVHSYEAKPAYDAHRLADTVYGGRRLCAAAQKGSVIGCQFHPEKSGKLGLSVIHRYLILCEAAH